LFGAWCAIGFVRIHFDHQVFDTAWRSALKHSRLMQGLSKLEQTHACRRQTGTIIRVESGAGSAHSGDGA
jgi:hypothetical protein